jgi:hypothetical protein
MECLECDSKMVVDSTPRNIIYKNIPISIDTERYLCLNCGLSIVNSKQMENTHTVLENLYTLEKLNEKHLVSGV